jgi:hypothetical protein
MESAARRRDANGGEYLRAGLRLRARGGRKEAKSSQTRARKDYRRDSSAAAENNFRSPNRIRPLRFI